MALHTKKVLFITLGVITLAVVAGILTLLLNTKAFKPQIEKESVFKSITGSILNPLKDAWKLILGKSARYSTQVP